tara:strand:+ start:61 stop:225 length:165 start_codon:yes stop_codon:yes gene_type:complete
VKPEQMKNITIRADQVFSAKIDDWRRTQKDIPSRADAVRQLVERGLKAEQSAQK